MRIRSIGWFCSFGHHDAAEIAKYPHVVDQAPFRKEAILETIKEKGYSLEDFDAICEELKHYSVYLSNRPMIVAANKCDLLMPESDNLERLRAHVEAAGCKLYEISAGTTQGTKNLMRVVAEQLRTLPPVTIYEPEYVEIIEAPTDPSAFEIEHYGNTWLIAGKWLERMVQNINLMIMNPGTTLICNCGKWVCSSAWSRWEFRTEIP